MTPYETIELNWPDGCPKMNNAGNGHTYLRGCHLRPIGNRIFFLGHGIQPVKVVKNKRFINFAKKFLGKDWVFSKGSDEKYL